MTTVRRSITVSAYRAARQPGSAAAQGRVNESSYEKQPTPSCQAAIRPKPLGAQHAPTSLREEKGKER